MNTITVSHRGRLVALAAPHRFWLAGDIEALPDGHPRKRFVAFMVLYARDVLTGEITGPYRDEDAERFAYLALLDPSVAAQHAHSNDAQLADLLGLPIDEVHMLLPKALEHHRPAAMSGPRGCSPHRRRPPRCDG
jgi:hypothetical protein